MDARVLGKLYKVLHTVLIAISSLQIANSIREAGIQHDCYQVGLVLGTSRGRMMNENPTLVGGPDLSKVATMEFFFAHGFTSAVEMHF